MARLKSVFLFLLAVSAQLCIARNCDYLHASAHDSSKIIEKVYLHTDRDCYSPGDDLWFKAYLAEASDMRLSGHSMNLHVELISSEPKIIDSRIVRMEEGLGNGDFRLPDSLRPGTYMIRAYTNYMRNFNDRQFFTKAITVVSFSDPGELKSASIEYPINRFDVKFFPEGGSLINDVTTVVGFKATDSYGSGCDVSGEVFTSSGDFVTSFKSTHHGMGKFILRPVQGLDYFAIASNSDGDTTRFEIPKSFSSGLVLNVTDFQNDEPLITIRTNPLTLPELLDRDMLLTVSARQKILMTLNFKIASLFTSFRLPGENLPDGDRFN